MRISMIGSGTVGYAVGKGLSYYGHDVLFCDTNEARVNELKEEDVHATLQNKIREITFITVPAPTTEEGTIEFQYLEEALTDIGHQIRKRNDYPIIVVKSTILPHLLKEKVIPLLENVADSSIGDDFGFCYNPEFLREKYAEQDFMDPDRIVLGECDKKATEKLEKLYEPFDAPIYRIGLEEAAMVKYAANVFLATKISFFNELFLILKEWGINPDTVASVVREDRRITDYGTVGGQEFGGKCLPKDLKAFLHTSKQHTNPSLLTAVKKVNEKIKDSEYRRDIEVD